MNIVVCVKQVPGTAQVEIDPETGVLKRDGVEAKMNPYDLYAIETALRVREIVGGEITAVAMGPGQAEAVLREAFMMGVDHGVLVSDRRFGGADVLATSYTLSQAVRRAGRFDLVICGKQTTDGDTAQVGAELAEFLEIPHIANVTRIVAADGEGLTVDFDLPLDVAEARVGYPCLVTAEKGIFEPRLPSYRRMLATEDRAVRVLTLDDMDDRDPARYGLDGSPTRVKRIFPPDNDNVRESWTGEPGELAGRLYELLDRKKFLQQPG